MKKLLGLLLLFIFSFSLVGCFNIYADDSKNDMDLVDVKVYGKDNNELKGTYKNFFGSRNPKSKDNNKEELNSAAPVFNYYVVEGVLGESYTIKFYFYSKRGYKLTKAVFDDYESVYGDTKYEITDIEYIDKQYVATITIENLSEENDYYDVGYWYDGEDIRHSFGSRGSNTYIKGAYLELPKEEENTGWTY